MTPKVMATMTTMTSCQDRHVSQRSAHFWLDRKKGETYGKTRDEPHQPPSAPRARAGGSVARGSLPHFGTCFFQRSCHLMVVVRHWWQSREQVFAAAGMGKGSIFIANRSMAGSPLPVGVVKVRYVCGCPTFILVLAWGTRLHAELFRNHCSDKRRGRVSLLPVTTADPSIFVLRCTLPTPSEILEGQRVTASCSGSEILLASVATTPSRRLPLRFRFRAELGTAFERRVRRLFNLWSTMSPLRGRRVYCFFGN